MSDIGMAAFSLFFMQSESFLSHQRQLEKGRGTGNFVLSAFARDFPDMGRDKMRLTDAMRAVAPDRETEI
jgi:hypothetical protein